MNLKDLEGKTINELSIDERKFIRNAYMDYFDTMNPRNRAIGYCVVCGGIPQMKIGQTDFFFWKNKTILCQFQKFVNDVPYALMFEHTEGNRRVFNADIQSAILEGGEGARFADVLMGFIKSDSRFCDAMNGSFDKSVSLPAFIPLMNSKYQRLDSCKCLMSKASQAIGFDAKHFSCDKLANVVYSPQFAAIS